MASNPLSHRLSLASLGHLLGPARTGAQALRSQKSHMPVQWRGLHGSQRITPSRPFSTTISSHHPRIPRSKGRNVFFESTERNTVDEGQRLLERLEEEAVAVAEADAQFTKELGIDAPATEYLKFALARLQPLLQYGTHHSDAQFLKAYAPQGSSIDRAREAAVYLFISAQGWITLAVNAAKSRSQDLDPEIVDAAENFGKVVTAIESYLEDKLPEDMDWSDVGAVMLSVSRDAWTPMYKVVEDNTHIKPDGNKNAEKPDKAAS